VISQKAESSALGEDGRLIPDRAVLEMKNQPGRHTVALGCLDQVAARQVRAIERTENQECEIFV